MFLFQFENVFLITKYEQIILTSVVFIERNMSSERILRLNVILGKMKLLDDFNEQVLFVLMYYYQVLNSV